MWKRAGRGGTHVAILVAVGVGEMGSFGFIARSTIAITAPIERLCDNNKYGVSFLAYLSIAKLRVQHCVLNSHTARGVVGRQPNLFFNTQCQFGVAAHIKTIDMWTGANRGGTHVAKLAIAVMVSFSFLARSTLAITAPTERLCDKQQAMR
jgi:hypothetical protein